MYSAKDLVRVCTALSTVCNISHDAVVILQGPDDSQIEGKYDKPSKSFSWIYSTRRNGVQRLYKMDDNCELLEPDEKRKEEAHFYPWLQEWSLNSLYNL